MNALDLFPRTNSLAAGAEPRKAIIGCEYSGTVRDAFTNAGWLAMSCDILPTESNGPHYQGDIIDLLDSGHEWDLGIFHPVCTAMAVCGNHKYAGSQDREDAIAWTVNLWEKAKRVCKAVCFENPASVIFPVLRKMGADVQYIQPNQFGHPETKKTGLALHNLPRLVPEWDVTDIMETLPNKHKHRIWYASPGEDRGKERSKFFPGIGRAMARQWGSLEYYTPQCERRFSTLSACEWPECGCPPEKQ